MKKLLALLLIIPLLAGAKVNLVKSGCDINIVQGGEIVLQIPISGLSAYSYRSNIVKLRNGEMTYTQDISEIRNYATVSDLIDSVLIWKSSCQPLSPGNIASQNINLNTGKTLFNQLTVAESYSLADLKLSHDKDPVRWDEVYFGGMDTAIYIDSTSSVKATTDAVGEKFIRQTFQRYGYQAAREQIIYWTGVCEPETGTLKRYGYFNSDTVKANKYDANKDGIWFETKNDSAFFVIARSGTIVERVYQGDWNINTGSTIDWSKGQIWIAEYGWLGYLGVRFSIVQGANIVPLHFFTGTNTIKQVFMTSSNHSIRAEMEQIGATGGSITITCQAVQSLGGFQPTGILTSKNTNGTHLDANAENTKYVAIAARIADGHEGVQVDVDQVNMQIQTANEKVLWEIILNPTIAGSLSYTENGGCVEFALGATANTLTGGTILASGFAESGGTQAGNSGSANQGLANALRLGMSTAGVKDVLVLSIMPIAASTDVDIETSLSIREY